MTIEDFQNSAKAVIGLLAVKSKNVALQPGFESLTKGQAVVDHVWAHETRFDIDVAPRLGEVAPDDQSDLWRERLGQYARKVLDYLQRSRRDSTFLRSKPLCNKVLSRFALKFRVIAVAAEATSIVFSPVFSNVLLV